MSLRTLLELVVLASVEALPPGAGVEPESLWPGSLRTKTTLFLLFLPQFFLGGHAILGPRWMWGRGV